MKTKHKFCGLPTGHYYVHTLDRKQAFILGWPYVRNGAGPTHFDISMNGSLYLMLKGMGGGQPTYTASGNKGLVTM